MGTISCTLEKPYFQHLNDHRDQIYFPKPLRTSQIIFQEISWLLCKSKEQFWEAVFLGGGGGGVGGWVGGWEGDVGNIMN